MPGSISPFSLTKPLRLLFLSLALLQPAASAWAAPRLQASAEGISEYRLANGLQVLLAPDASKPSTHVNMTYRVGAKHENYGEAGLAHLLEHMIFKGTPRHPSPWADFSRLGINANASTGHDRSNYFASFAADEAKLRWLLAWQADAMHNSRIRQSDLEAEMSVVRSEMDISDGDLDFNLESHALAAMYQWHSYKRPVIGTRSDVENIKASQLRQFYRRYYQPSNATLIISGSFEPAKALAWVQQSFGALPAGPGAPAPRHTLEAAQDGERSVVIRRSGGVAALRAAYHAPAAAHPDYAAIELLQNMLSAAPGGRLAQRLVSERKLASRISASNELRAEPGVMMLTAELAAGAEPAELQRELLQVLEQELSTSPITATELQRAKTRWLNQWEQTFADAERLSLALSNAVGQGDWRLHFLLRDRVKALSLAELQRVARERLLPANRSLVLYLPTEQPQRAPSPSFVDARQALRDFKPGPAPAAVPAFDSRPAEIDRLTLRSQLPGGMRLALLPKPTRGGMLESALVLRMGNANNLRGQAAVAELLAGLLGKGTQGLDAQALSDRMDALQMSLQISAEADRLTLTWRSQRRHAAAAVQLVAEVLRRPLWQQSLLDEVRTQLLGNLQTQRNDPELLAANALAQTLSPWPRGDVRHARSFDEMAADLQAVSLDQLRDFHQRFYGSSHAQFAAVGDFDPAALSTALQQALGDWQAPAAYAALPRPLANASAEAEALAAQAQQAQRLQLPLADKRNAALLARLDLAVNDEHADHAALLVANRILGGGSDSRLWKRIREREGLSYNVWSYWRWGGPDLNSVWHLGALFAPQQRAQLEQALLEEVRQLSLQGANAAELRSAQQALLGERRLARMQDAKLATNLATGLYRGHNQRRDQALDDAIQALTLAQLNAALQRHLRVEALRLAYAGDINEAGHPRTAIPHQSAAPESR